MSNFPYQAEKRSGSWWLVIDTRTDQGASYPTSEANAKAEAETLNRAYVDAIKEEARSAKERMLAAINSAANRADARDADAWEARNPSIYR